jgi:hypothetical protein
MKVLHRVVWIGGTSVWWLVASALPVAAHAGTADGSRPFITGVEPAVPGIAATAVFAGSWEINLVVGSNQDVSALDDGGRPFLRIGRRGVEADYGAPAWYLSAVAPNASGAVRLPDGIGPASPPDWRLLSSGRAWAWFDPRIAPDPGAVTPQMIKDAVPVRLRDFSIPLQVEDRPAQIRGYLEFEPPRGRYVHQLLSPARPAPGVEVGLLAGQAVPTVTVRNDSADQLTVLGGDGEPFLRVGQDVEANLASPTWVQVSRALGRTPRTLADATSPPQWERISEGRLMSWADFRSRPPDAEPPLAVVRAGRAVEVRRWTIPLRLGGQSIAIQGATSFEPLPVADHRPSQLRRIFGLAVVAVAVSAAVALVLRRRTDAEPPG